MSDPIQTGALSHIDLADRMRGLLIAVDELRDHAVIDLRLGAADKAAHDAASAALGLNLPTTPRTSATFGDITCLWFSIDQWLILVPRASVADVMKRMERALVKYHHGITDVSDMRCILRLSGPSLRTVLAKCTPTDMFANAVEPGFVQRITFGEIAAAVHFVSADPDTADLFVFRSYASYAIDWLVDAADPARTVSLFSEQAIPAV